MTGHENPNVAVVRQGFAAFDAGDLTWVKENLADDIVWHVGGRSKMAGSYEGKDAVLDLFARQAQLGGSAPSIDVHDVVGNDEHVVAIGVGTVEDPDGGTVEWKWANVFHVRDGKVAEVWGLSEDPSAIDAVIDKAIDRTG